MSFFLQSSRAVHCILKYKHLYFLAASEAWQGSTGRRIFGGKQARQSPLCSEEGKLTCKPTRLIH